MMGGWKHGPAQIRSPPHERTGARGRAARTDAAAPLRAAPSVSTGT